jgi:hypothetical protein
MKEVFNLFKVNISQRESDLVEQVLHSETVRKIHLLPSFKLKKTEISKGFVTTRLDDVVIEGKELNPELFNYQIGCGYLTVKMDINYSWFNECNTQEFGKKVITNLPRPYFIIFKKVIGRLTGKKLKVSVNSPESIQRENWLAAVAAGPIKYLSERSSKELDFSNLQGQFKDLSGELENIKHLLNKSWIDGSASKQNDAHLASLDGSHYADILGVEDTKIQEWQEKSALHVHAHGSSLPGVLSPDAFKKLRAGRISEEKLNIICELMKNQAAINRLAIFLKLKSYLSELCGTPIGCCIINDQTHHEYYKEGDNYLVYNDSQRLTDGRLTMLPSGYPNSYGYLVAKGSNSIITANGVSHNLKRPIIEDVDKLYTDKAMTKFDLFESKMISQTIRKKYSMDVIQEGLVESNKVKEIIKYYEESEIIDLYAKFFPIVRLNFKGRK